MLTVTHAAGGYLSELLEQSQAPSDSAVRIRAESGGLRTAIDQEKAGDSTFEHGGRKVLLLDEKAATVLSEHTLDVDPAGVQLVCRK